MVVIAVTLLCSACSPSVDPIFLHCKNPLVERGNHSSSVVEGEGLGEVTVSIEPSGNRGHVVFAESMVFTGKLELDEDIFVVEDSSADAKYPHRKRRLKVNRRTGNGFLQSSSYADATSTPDFQTFHLADCAARERRF